VNQILNVLWEVAHLQATRDLPKMFVVQVAQRIICTSRVMVTILSPVVHTFALVKELVQFAQRIVYATVVFAYLDGARKKQEMLEIHVKRTWIA